MKFEIDLPRQVKKELILVTALICSILTTDAVIISEFNLMDTEEPKAITLATPEQIDNVIKVDEDLQIPEDLESFECIDEPIIDWEVVAKDMIKSRESFRAKTYKCPKGKATIGYGHTGKHLSKKSITKAEASKILDEDLDAVAKDVDEVVKVELTENQRWALISFTFNAGRYSLYKMVNKPNGLNAGNYKSIESELPKYVYAGKKKLQGLVDRREDELKIWKGIN